MRETGNRVGLLFATAEGAAAKSLSLAIDDDDGRYRAYRNAKDLVLDDGRGAYRMLTAVKNLDSTAGVYSNAYRS